jgi:hypothetical protein
MDNVSIEYEPYIISKLLYSTIIVKWIIYAPSIPNYPKILDNRVAYIVNLKGVLKEN